MTDDELCGEQNDQQDQHAGAAEQNRRVPRRGIQFVQAGTGAAVRTGVNAVAEENA